MTKLIKFKIWKLIKIKNVSWEIACDDVNFSIEGTNLSNLERNAKANNNNLAKRNEVSADNELNGSFYRFHSINRLIKWDDSSVAWVGRFIFIFAFVIIAFGIDAMQCRAIGDGRWFDDSHLQSIDFESFLMASTTYVCTATVDIAVKCFGCFAFWFWMTLID